MKQRKSSQITDRKAIRKYLRSLQERIKKSGKPLLEWKLAYLENGERRLARTEEEDRELDEILHQHEHGHLTALAFALLHKSKAEEMAKDQNVDLRKLGEYFSLLFSYLEEMIIEGRGYVGSLIQLMMIWNETFHDLPKPTIDLALRRLAEIRNLTPARKKKGIHTQQEVMKLYQQAPIKSYSAVKKIYDSLPPDEQKKIPFSKGNYYKIRKKSFPTKA